VDMPGQHSSELAQVLENFIDSGMRGAKIQGMAEILAEMFQAIVKERGFPIEVLEKRNTIYFRRTDNG
jgi:hypothetical protein